MLYKLVTFIFLVSLNLFADTGFMQKSVLNEDRKLDFALWYPSLEKEDELFAQNEVFLGFKAKKNAKIVNRKLPLIIFAHGTTGNWRNLSWLAKKLAKNSIVLAANHPGSTSRDSNPKTVLKLWTQSKDINFLISHLLKSDLKDRIDVNNIFVLGYSLGGYTALALSGAKLDMSTYKDFCQKYEDEACKYFKNAMSIIDEEYLKKSSMNLKDERIKGVIAITPGFVQNMTNKSLNKIDIPSLIIGAQLDHNVPVETVIKAKMKYFSKSIIYYEVKDASHFSFMQICTNTKKANLILKEENALFICKDGIKKSRQDIHKETYKLIKNFINKYKK